MQSTKENELEFILKLRGLLTPLVIAAINQAKKSHGMQVRDDTTSYLESHIFSIVKDLVEYVELDRKIMERIIIVALLHDTLEDDHTLTQSDLLKNFPTAVVDMVEILTKPYRPGNVKLTNDEKFRMNADKFRLIFLSPFECRIVKLADRLNNIMTIPSSWSAQKKARYVKEAWEFVLPLAHTTHRGYYERILKEVKRL